MAAGDRTAVVVNQPLAGPRNITAEEFRQVSELLHRHTGVRLVPGKETLVMGRLDRRLRQLGLRSYGEYLKLVLAPGQGDELRQLIDRLTTNETFFFREPQHFDFLREVILPAHTANRPFRMWSAACSSGEEAYTAAMVLAEAVPSVPWEIIGTDISSQVVGVAQRGVYPIAAAEKIPTPLLRKYCRKGRDDYQGLMAVHRSLRDKVTFLHANLMSDLQRLGRFDLIMVRNVMIYFDTPTKHGLVARLADMLYPGGYLMISHSESLNGFPTRVQMVAPSVYQINGDHRDQRQ